MELRLPSILAPDQAIGSAVMERQDHLTKPAGSLGRLEDLAVWLATVQARERPQTENATVYVVAADHGVSQRGVSAYPQEVTAQMVANFLAGGAAINALSRSVEAAVRVVDAGIATDLGEREGLLRLRIGSGTGDFSFAPAMTKAEAIASVEAGLQLASAGDPPDLLILGEMGIGNTTSASAIAAAVLEADPLLVTGTGTGIDEEARLLKAKVIQDALRLHAPNPNDALDVLAKVGGFETGVLSGLMIGGAARRAGVIIDGFVCGAAALVAVGLTPTVRDYLLAAHRSTEPGHKYVLERLRLRPLFDLDMRLGEGSGAVLALPLVRAAVRALNEMATFEEATVAGPQGRGRGA